MRPGDRAKRSPASKCRWRRARTGSAAAKIPQNANGKLPKAGSDTALPARSRSSQSAPAPAAPRSRRLRRRSVPRRARALPEPAKMSMKSGMAATAEPRPNTKRSAPPELNQSLARSRYAARSSADPRVPALSPMLYSLAACPGVVECRRITRRLGAGTLGGMLGA